MNKKIYFYIIYFLYLTIAATILNSIIHFVLGPEINKLSFYLHWSLGVNLITLIGSVLILKYYLHKKYWSALVFGTFSTIATFSSFALVYTMISSAQLMTYYLPALTISASLGLIYGISLIFSIAGQRRWLRFAGIITVIISGILLMTFISWMNSPQILANGRLDRIIQWTTLVSILTPVFYIKNFLDELKSFTKDSPNKLLNKYGIHDSLTIRLISFLFGIISIVFFTQAFLNVVYTKQNYNISKKLAENFEERVFVGSQGDTLFYRFLAPLEYDPREKYPLMVALHHGGLHGNDNIKQLSSPPVPLLSGDFHREKYPTFLFVPQSPRGSGFGRVANSPSIDSLVFEAIKEFEKEFSIDKTRRYVMGTSGGGYGSWNFISTHPEMFAAAIPICGGGDPKFAPNLTNVEIWAFHGAKDKKVPVRLSRDMIEAIKKAGGNPRYTEFPNSGHEIWESVKATPDLMEWLFEQKRED